MSIKVKNNSIHCRIYKLQAAFNKTNELDIYVNEIMSVLFTIIYYFKINFISQKQNDLIKTITCQS